MIAAFMVPQDNPKEGELQILKALADAKIERLERDLKDCRNELCLRCGEYKKRHLGACDGCRWYVNDLLDRSLEELRP